jgi:formate-dependent nitrite reductase membrane component NrfD
MDLVSTYRPQREWIEGRGILIVIAHFFSGVGAGAWLFAVFFDHLIGQLIAVACVGAASLAHLAFLGRWKRFIRVLARPRTSWVSRGTWGIVIFTIGAVAYLLPWGRDSALDWIFLGTSFAGVAIILLCSGFVYSVSKAIPFWNTILLPILYIAYGLRGGVALLLVAGAMGSGVFDLDTMEAIKLWVLASTVVLILLYLIAANRSGGAASHSVTQLIAGRISFAFYGGTIGIGILVPVVLAAAREVGATGMLTLAVIGVASLIGDFYVKYCIVKAGAYVPLSDAVPRPRPSPA